MALDLCTLADLKGYLEGLSNVDKYDVVLSSLITMMSRRMEQYCNRIWDNNGAADITEYFSGDTGMSFIIVKRIPIVSITYLYDDTNRVYGASTLLDTTDYTYFADEGIIQLDGITFAKGIKNIKVVYKGGFTTHTIPADLRLACVMESAKTFEMRKRLGLDSMSDQGGSVVIATNPALPTQFLPEVRAILDSYKSYRLIQ